jgi:D-alanyl-D-alanine carboxypeptidase
MGNRATGVDAAHPLNRAGGPRAAHRSASRKILALLVVSLLATAAPPLTGIAGAASTAGWGLPTARLKAAVQEAMKGSASPGALVGVWVPGKGQWIFAGGTSDTATGAPMRANMHFRIASNTKSMTCTVLLELVDQRKVRLDDPVAKYVTGFSGLQGITLHQLCQNTSGLGDYFVPLTSQFFSEPTRVWSPTELVSAGLEQPRTGTPGEHFSYSNTGFVLLGMALQNATKESWARLYQKDIFDRLGLRSTSFPNAEDFRIPAPSASGYASPIGANGRSVPGGALTNYTQLSNSMGWTAGGAISTLSDLHRYVVALAKGSLLSRASARAQWTTVPLSSSSPAWQSYGLGAMQMGPYRGHDGEIPGFISAMMADPKTGASVVVLLNNSSAGGEYALLEALRLIAIISPRIVPWTDAQMAKALQSVALPGSTVPSAPKQ